MSRHILFVFEGERQEINYAKSFIRHFFSEETVVLTSFFNDIFELYRIIKDDDDLDLVEILKENPKNNQLSEITDRDSISEIYLFFDLEIQDEKFSFNVLREMIGVFNEETNKGKIFISYPMIESIRDIPSLEAFTYHFVDVSQCTGAIYKKLSSERGMKTFLHAKKMTKDNWVALTSSTMQKIVKINAFDSLDENKMQIKLSLIQESYVENERKIAVINSFPVFLFDYFGSQTFPIDDQETTT